MQERRERGVLGILGSAPRDLPDVVRVRRWADFTRLVSDLELYSPAEFAAGHAACQALMHGVEGVTFVPVDANDEEALEEAAQRLRRHSVTCVAAPELVTASAQRALLRHFDVEDVRVLIDVPRGASFARVIELAHELADPRAVVVTPWVRALSPGRRSPEWMPASCLAAPLLLGRAPVLKGVFESPSAVGAEWEARLREHGVAWLSATPRGGLRLRGAARSPRAASAPAPGGPNDVIAALVEEACAEEIAVRPSGPALWKTLERRVRAVLEPLVRSGTLRAVHVRCDRETNEGSAEPVLEVLYTPNAPRVRQVRLRLRPTSRAPSQR